MKKILLTTTALTMLAGAAAADINLTGSGRMGVTRTGGTTTTTHRFRVNFNASGETDGGLTFGAYVRANMNGGAVGAIGAPRVWIGNGTATLTIGNAGGAVSAASNIFGCGIGFTGSCADMAAGGNSFTWVSHASGGAGANVIRLDFSMGSANVSVSGGNTNDTELGVNFALGSATIGIGYDGGAAATGGTYVNASFNAGSANVGVQVAQSNGTTGYMINASMGVGAGSVYVGAGNQLNSGATATQVAYHLGYSQSLGGGATAAVSYRSVAGTATWDAGVRFGF